MSKTIFNIIQSNNKGGMENIFLDYAQILAENKNNFDQIAIVSKNFVHLEALEKAGIKIEILNIHGHFDFIAAFKLGFLIKKYQPHVIMAHNGRAFATINLARLFFNFKKIKLLAVSHGGSVWRILKFHYIIAVATHIENKIKSYGFKGKVETIHNGIKIAPYIRPAKTSASFDFGIMSRLSKEKDIETAIWAFSAFWVLHTKLIIAGEGPEREELEILARNLGVHDRVKFIGWVKDKKSFFEKIDVFLQPAPNEPFGLTILEAFNYRVPVIAADDSGPKEIIRDQENGLLFIPGSHHSLLRSMKYLHQNPKQLKHISNTAHTDLIIKFSYDKMAYNLITFLNQIQIF